MTTEKERRLQSRLIKACNLLCDYVHENLPQGWTIRLTMDSEEASLELTDPDGIDIDPGATEHDTSSLKLMCDCAREIEEEGLRCQ